MKLVKRIFLHIIALILVMGLYSPVPVNAQSYTWMESAKTIPINKETETYECKSENNGPWSWYVSDAFYFYIPADLCVSILVNADGADTARWYLYNENGEEVGHSKDDFWKYDKNADLNRCSAIVDNLPKGGYYIKFSSHYTDQITRYFSFQIKTYVPTKTRITSIKPGKKSITIKWNKASGADGYIIYRATTKKGKYKQIAKIVGKKNKYKIKNVKYNKAYYYKVLAYKTINGKKIYSANRVIRKYKLKK